MKKYLPHTHPLVLLAGILAMLLRYWNLSLRPDSRGLYPDNHISWLLLCLLTVVVVIWLLVLSRFVDPRRRYKENFPFSWAGLLGLLCGAMSILLTGLAHYQADLGFSGTLLGVLGVGSAVMLGMAIWLRYRGQRPLPMTFAVPCLYFAMRVFFTGKLLGAEPQTSRYLFEFFASVSLLPASYYLWGFDLDLGHRRASFFWSLTAAFLCMAATPGSDDWALYLSSAVLLLTNLCSLRPRRRPRKPSAVSQAAQAPLNELLGEELSKAVPDKPIHELSLEELLQRIDDLTK